MHQWVSVKTIAAVSALLAAGVLGAACSSETGGSASGGGDGGTASAASTQASTGSQSSSSGQGGAGGGAGGAAGCGDTMTDPANCGVCGNECIPGLSCTAGVCACPADAAGTLSGDAQPIFTTSCVKAMSCHGNTAAEKLNLSSGIAFGELVGVDSQCADKRKLVTPSNPEESYILNKLLGKGLCEGKRMPLNATALSKEKIASITSWICAGALDN